MFRKTHLLVILLLVVLAACNQALLPEAEVPPEVPVPDIALPPGVRAPWDDTPPDPDELSVMFGGAQHDAAYHLAKHNSGVFVSVKRSYFAMRSACRGM
jgi:hypothetical protein